LATCRDGHGPLPTRSILPPSQSETQKSVRQTKSKALETVFQWWLYLNLPFLIGHPQWGADLPMVLRTLAINLVLFVVVGLAWFVPRKEEQWPSLRLVIYSLFGSLGVFLLLLGLFQLTGWQLTANRLWNVTWLCTNLLFGARVVWGGALASPVPRSRAGEDYRLSTSFVLFLAAYGLFFFGAERVVTPQEDHDWEVQGTGYALLDRMEPLLITDRGNEYFFAHPPLLHYYVAASFLYHNALDYLQQYDEASRRAYAASHGLEFKPYRGLVWNSRVVAVDGADYILLSPIGERVRHPVKEVELQVTSEIFEETPHTLETRTPTIFLAALTVAMIGYWSVKVSGRWWIGLVVGAAYATSPEVFVRSSYGGYFGISNFGVASLLLATVAWDSRRGKREATVCFLVALLLALANHKLVLLPVGLATWELLRSDRLGGLSRIRRALLHPALLGFAAGTAVFWMYGLLISAGAFWEDHLRTHLFDRIAHHNPLGYGGYPSMLGLWGELFSRTGYVLVPLGAIALCCVVPQRKIAELGEDFRVGTGGWLVWALLCAVLFSLVDWRMTKHLMPLMVLFHLTPVLWAGRRNVARYAICTVFVCLLAWNVQALLTLASDFDRFSLSVTPQW